MPVCLRLHPTAGFTEHAYVQVPAVREHAFSLETNIEKAFYQMALPFLQSLFMVLNSAFQV